MFKILLTGAASCSVMGLSSDLFPNLKGERIEVSVIFLEHIFVHKLYTTTPTITYLHQ